MKKSDIYILAIESSCDDTGVAVLKNKTLLSNVIAKQEVHEKYGGVIPELASRAHQSNIVPTIDLALKNAGIEVNQLNAIAFTQGPGLMGSLLVGNAFAKSMAYALNIPLLGVHHMHAHLLAHLIDDGNPTPEFPFLGITISGGHTQLVKVNNVNDFEIIGETTDDAIGEAYDKTAKLLGFPYPGGPYIDKYAQDGDPLKYKFTKPKVGEFEFSFSGLKTQILYFLQRNLNENPNFITENLADICASIQYTIINILVEKIENAAKITGLKHIVLGGGVSANRGIRKKMQELATKHHWQVFLPPMQLATDNAAMIGITAYYKYLNNDFTDMDAVSMSKFAM